MGDDAATIPERFTQPRSGSETSIARFRPSRKFSRNIIFTLASSFALGYFIKQRGLAILTYLALDD